MLQGYTKINNKVMFLERDQIKSLSKELNGLVTTSKKQYAKEFKSYKVNKDFLKIMRKEK